MKIGILGGGLTGLTIASALKQDYEVLERDSECGGLCRSLKKEGYTFDQGGHILYSRQEWIAGIIVRVDCGVISQPCKKLLT